MDGHEGETKEANKDGPTAEPDYAEQLNQWAIQVNNMFHMTVGFPYFMLNQANFSLQCQCVLLQQQQAQLQTQYAQLLQLEQQNGQTRQRDNRGYMMQFLLYLMSLLSPTQTTPLSYNEFKIPPLWKRVAAEILDFSFLMAFKFCFTLLALDWFDLFDFDKYDDILKAVISGDDIDLPSAVSFTQELFYLEVLHRLFVSIFETVCIYKGQRGISGGATPGKMLMGLRIYRIRSLVERPLSSRVEIAHTGHLGILSAAIRSVLKNLSVTFFFPINLLILFLPHNRAWYDILARTIVVEVASPFGPPHPQFVNNREAANANENPNN